MPPACIYSKSYLMLIREIEALGLRQGKYKPRKGKVAGVVIHTTGAGPWKRWHGNPTKYCFPSDAAVHVYRAVMPYSGHFVVCGETGRITQVCPTDRVALHVGSKGGYKYRWPHWYRLADVAWWQSRWPDLHSPRGLMGGQAWAPRPNARTVGIEVAPPVSGPRDEWTPAAWNSLAWLCNQLADQYDIPRTKYNFVGHSDVHPFARSAKGLPWDPNGYQFHPAIAQARLFTEGYNDKVG